MTTSNRRGLFFLVLVAAAVAAGVWLNTGEDQAGSDGAESAVPDRTSADGSEGPEGPDASIEAPPNEAAPLVGEGESQVRREVEARVEELVVTGRVVSTIDGAVVPGGRVVVLSEPPPFLSVPLRGRSGWSGSAREVEPVATAPVDADGRFVLRAPIRHGFFATDQPGYYVRDLVPISTGTGDITLRVAPAGRLTGRVETPAGASVAGAEVHLDVPLDPLLISRQGRRIRGALVETDDQGRFSFERAPPGSLILRVDATGHPETTERVELVPFETVDVTVVLDQGYELRGRVVDERDEPIPAASVRVAATVIALSAAQRGEFSDHERKATTGEDGRFVVVGLPEGQFDVIARSDRYALGKTRHVKVPGDGSAAEVTVVLRGGQTIAGRVVDADGEGVPRAEVGFYQTRGFFGLDLSATIRPRDAEDLGGAWTYADDEGRFTSPALPDGAYSVGAEAEGWERAALSDVPAGTDGHVLTLERSGSIHGIVLSRADAEPVAAFRLAVTRPFELLDMKSYIPAEVHFSERGDGTFVVEGVTPGDWTLEVTGERFGRAQAAVHVDAGEPTRGVIILLPEEACLRGVVVSSVTGAPIEGASVSTRSGMEVLRPDPLGDGDVLTDRDGGFELRGLAAGRLQLSVRAKDHAPGSSARLSLVEGSVVEDVVIRLDKGAIIRGTVTDAAGAPIEGAIVQAVLIGTVIPAMTTTDAEGGYELTGLAPGSYTVNKVGGKIDVGADDMLSSVMQGLATKTARLKSGEELVLDFRAGEGGTVLFTGRVTEGGDPLPNAIVTLTPDDLGGLGGGGMRMTSTDRDGEFELEGMQPGDWTMTIQSGSPLGQSTKQSFDVSIPDAPTFRDDYPLAATGFEGLVTTDALHRPLSNVRVAVDALDEGAKVDAVSRAAGSRRVADVFTDADGKYRVGGLPPGRYQVVAGGPGMFGIGGSGYRRSEPREVLVRDGELVPRIDFRLAPGGAIAGRVVDTGGRSVSGATIFLVADGGELSRHFGEIVSDESGRYHADGLEPDRYTLIVKASGFAPAVEAGVRIRESEETERDVTVQTGANVTLELQDGGGAPAVGAVVRLFQPDGTELTQYVTIGDAFSEIVQGKAPGRYDLGALEPGSYSLQITWGGAAASIDLKHGGVDQVLVQKL